VLRPRNAPSSYISRLFRRRKRFDQTHLVFDRSHRYIYIYVYVIFLEDLEKYVLFTISSIRKQRDTEARDPETLERILREGGRKRKSGSCSPRHDATDRTTLHGRASSRPHLWSRFPPGPLCGPQVPTERDLPLQFFSSGQSRSLRLLTA